MGFLCFNCGTKFDGEKEINEHDCQQEIRKREQRRAESDPCVCKTCRRRFGKPCNLLRHEAGGKCKFIRESDRTVCKFCRKSFSGYTSRQRHEKRCKNAVSNEKQIFQRPNSPAGESYNTSEQSPEKGVKCRKCNFKCSTLSDLYQHRMLNHSQADPASLQEQPWGDAEMPPWENDNGTPDFKLRQVYHEQKHLILKKKETELTTVTRYNFPVSNNLSMREFQSHIDDIYEGSANAFKINLSFGIMLKHAETGQYRYFTPYSNENVFELPMLISRRVDIRDYMERLSELDILNYMARQRPESVWKPVMICNIVYTVFRTSFALGRSKKLPNYIKTRTSIISLECDPHTGKPFEDELCMFRCLAYHKIKSTRSIQKLTKTYYTQWLFYVEKHKLRTSEISVANIPHVENCFQANINVFSLSRDKSCIGVYKSMETFADKTIYLNLHQNHLSYISNFRTYASKYRCLLCEQMFPTARRLNRHAKTCENITKLRFPGGYYKQSKTIFDKLEEWNIFVAPEKRFYPWFAVFDLESVLVPEEQLSDTNKKLINSHKPVCVCLCSNVPGFEKERFILNENADDLLEEMCNYLLLISNECRKLAKVRWNSVFNSFDKLECTWSRERDIDTESLLNDDDASEDFCGMSEARESSEFEPPSAEFVEKIAKENVWYRFMRDISENDAAKATYNEWGESSSESGSEVLSASSSQTSMDSDSGLSSDDDDDDDINDGDLKPVILNSRKRHLFESDDDETDDAANYSAANIKKRRFDERVDCSDSDEQSVNMAFSPEIADIMKRKVMKIKTDFELYCGQLPTLGFNSGKYDVNLIKGELAIHLGLHTSKGRKFVIKKNNNYVCISNSSLKFLDMCNYLPPGTSYDSFLVSFEVPVRKSFFPYEYLTDISKLDDKCLPPAECFYSSLKNRNTLENNAFSKYSRLIETENKSKDEALKILKLETVPESSIEDNYSKLTRVWKEKNMSTLRDFLQYYAELDVGPMVRGIKHYQDFFFSRNIDVFKDYISVPGIARKMLYDCGLKNGASFSLFDKFDADLYETFMNNMTGGPSIIFTRRHKVGETFVRSDASRVCRSIFGYDANSLYLYAICQDMPVGRYIRRKSARAFRPENNVKRYFAMYDWMNWVSNTTGQLIRHKMNDGQEFKVGPYYVDGKSDTNEIYEFLGCYFHSHSCLKTKHPNHEVNYEKTMRRLEFLERQGFKVVSIWECEYRKQLAENEAMRKFVSNSLPDFYKKHPSSVTRDQILQGVMNEELFGFVEVDLEVPETWEQVRYKPNTQLSPYEYFEEMCPLFLTSEIPFQCIGKHMQEHVKAFNLSQKPRKLLVGGLRAKNMLVMTPLLKWYLSHGMRVTDIHQVVEYSRQACFKEFGEQIANARREGDTDNSKQVIALLFKLIGNSAFGGTIINKEKQKRHKYVKGFKNACLQVNNPRFANMDQFKNDIFEAEFKKGRVVIDTPIVLGIAILNIAKLHLLRFYYDALDTFIGRERFECIECDTDSLYFALSEATVSEAIKSDMRREFQNNLNNHCDDNYRPEPGVDNVWFPRECCAKHYKYDLKTPGLMKKEFEATRMTGLCSKSYVAKYETTGSVKYSLKGVNKNFVDPTEDFERVLASQNPAKSVNRGIALHNNTMYSYSQIKKAFSYFYCKREVCEDGVHTKPLNICLQPVKRN